MQVLLTRWATIRRNFLLSMELEGLLPSPGLSWARWTLSTITYLFRFNIIFSYLCLWSNCFSDLWKSYGEFLRAELKNLKIYCLLNSNFWIYVLRYVSRYLSSGNVVYPCPFCLNFCFILEPIRFKFKFRRLLSNCGYPESSLSTVVSGAEVLGCKRQLFFTQFSLISGGEIVI